VIAHLPAPKLILRAINSLKRPTIAQFMWSKRSRCQPFSEPAAGPLHARKASRLYSSRNDHLCYQGWWQVSAWSEPITGFWC